MWKIKKLKISEFELIISNFQTFDFNIMSLLALADVASIHSLQLNIEVVVQKIDESNSLGIQTNCTHWQKLSRNIKGI